MPAIDVLRYALRYWYITLPIVLFLRPVISRLLDFVSGRPKREAMQKELASQQAKLTAWANELAAQSSLLTQRERRLNDLVRLHTIKLAKDVASRPYLQTTPAYQAFSQNQDLAYDRLSTALTASMKIVAPFNISAQILSEAKHTYQTTLHSCTCPDFNFRGIPCKHMLRLAVEAGLLLSFHTTDLDLNVQRLLNQRRALIADVASTQCELEKLKQRQADYNHLLSDTAQSYPWLANLYNDFCKIQDDEVVRELRGRRPAAPRAAEKVAAANRGCSRWRVTAKQLEYQLHFYETLFPWLLDFKELPPKEAYGYVKLFQDAPHDDQNMLRNWLSPEEYSLLPDSEKYQLALDRYVARNKSSWEIGIEYERYIGYLCEVNGYSVQYNGAVARKEDMGRDLILKKGLQTILVQCKRWSKDKTIHENHVFQLAGSTYEYQFHHPDREVIGVFVTTTDFSPVALRCGELLGLQLHAHIPFTDYPRIKCNVSKGQNGEITKIFICLWINNMIE